MKASSSRSSHSCPSGAGNGRWTAATAGPFTPTTATPRRSQYEHPPVATKNGTIITTAGGLENLPRIHPPIGVRSLLHGAHHLHLDRRFPPRQLIALQPADAVLGRDRRRSGWRSGHGWPRNLEALLRDEHCPDRRPAGGDAEVDIPVAHMPEGDDIDARRSAVPASSRHAP